MVNKNKVLEEMSNKRKELNIKLNNHPMINYKVYPIIILLIYYIRLIF